MEQPVPPDAPPVVTDESLFTFNIAGVYQDALTRDWAMQVCHHAARMAGEERFQEA